MHGKPASENHSGGSRDPRKDGRVLTSSEETIQLTSLVCGELVTFGLKRNGYRLEIFQPNVSKVT